MTPLSTLIVFFLVNLKPLTAQNVGGLYDLYDWSQFASVQFTDRPQLRTNLRQQNTDPRLTRLQPVPLRNPSFSNPVLTKETEDAIAYVEDLLTGRLDLPENPPGSTPESVSRDPPTSAAPGDKTTDVVSSVTRDDTKATDGRKEDGGKGPVDKTPSTDAAPVQKPEGGGNTSGGNDPSGNGAGDTSVSSSTSPLPKTEAPKPATTVAPTKKLTFVTPCPGVFSYDRPNPGKERWYGEVTVTTNETLTELDVEVELDKASHFLGAWIGEVTSRDNIRYTIQSRKKKAEPGQPFPVKFFIKYSDKEVMPPRLKSIKLNGQQICPKVIGRQGVLHSPGRPNGPNRSSTSNAQNSKRQNQNGNTRPVASVPAEKEIKSNFGDQLPEDTEFVDGVACGRTEVQASPLITHGQRTARGQWPWHAALYHLKSTDLLFICGGSLIGIKTVLTAAHCVNHRYDNPIKPESLMVYLGKYHLKLWTDGGIQGKQVSEIHVNPEYNDTTYHADIAVLVLSTPVEFTEYVKPVCLWDRNRVQLNEIEGREGVVVGWGYDENGIVTGELKMAAIPVISQQTCIWSNPQFYSQYSSGTTFCAGFLNGTSPCNGDSGGGMVFPKATGKGTNGHQTWSLRGIVSLSVLQEEKRTCNTEHYAVFTDVVKFFSWINRFL